MFDSIAQLITLAGDSGHALHEIVIQAEIFLGRMSIDCFYQESPRARRS